MQASSVACWEDSHLIMGGLALLACFGVHLSAMTEHVALASNNNTNDPRQCYSFIYLERFLVYTTATKFALAAISLSTTTFPKFSAFATTLFLSFIFVYNFLGQPCVGPCSRPVCSGWLG